MNAERILTETFADHEHLAPDPDATWAAVESRLGSPRSPRRAAAVIATAATVTVLAAGGTVLLRDRAAETPTPPAATPTAAPAADARPAVSIRAGWLPPGAVQVGGQKGGEGAADFATVDNLRYRAGGLQILLGFSPGIELESRHDGSTTVNGEPGIVMTFGRDTSGLRFRLPDRRGVGTVVLRGPGRPATELAAIARRIATDLRFDRPQPLRMPFVLTYVPASLAVRTAVWDEPGEASYYWLGRPGGAPVTILSTEGTWQASPFRANRGPAEAGKPVRGHRTWVVRDDFGPSLFVESLWPGRSFVLGTTGTLPVDELYRIAEGIRPA